MHGLVPYIQLKLATSSDVAASYIFELADNMFFIKSLKTPITILAYR